MSERNSAAGLEIPAAHVRVELEKLVRGLNHFPGSLNHALWRAGYFLLLRRRRIGPDEHIYFWSIEPRSFRAKRVRRVAATCKKCSEKNRQNEHDNDPEEERKSRRGS